MEDRFRQFKRNVDSRYVLVALFFSALVFRLAFLAFVLTAEHGNPYPMGDSYRYMAAGRLLLELHQYTDYGVLSRYQGPGYAAFIAVSSLLGGHSPATVLIGQAILSAVTVCVIFSLTEAISPAQYRRIAALAAGIVGVANIGLTTFSGQLLSDTLGIFLFTLAVLVALRSNGAGRIGVTSAAVLMALAVLTGVAYSWSIIPVLLGLALYGVPWKRLVVFALIFVASLAPWASRNYIQFGDFSLSRSADHYLLFYFVPKVQRLPHSEWPAYQHDLYQRLLVAHHADYYFSNSYLASVDQTLLTAGVSRVPSSQLIGATAVPTASRAVLDNYFSNEYLALARKGLEEAGAARVFLTWVKGSLHTAGAVYYAHYAHALGVSTTSIGEELMSDNNLIGVDRQHCSKHRKHCAQNAASSRAFSCADATTCCAVGCSHRYEKLETKLHSLFDHRVPIGHRRNHVGQYGENCAGTVVLCECGVGAGWAGVPAQGWIARSCRQGVLAIRRASVIASGTGATGRRDTRRQRSQRLHRALQPHLSHRGARWVSLRLARRGPHPDRALARLVQPEAAARQPRPGAAPHVSAEAPEVGCSTSGIATLASACLM